MRPEQGKTAATAPPDGAAAEAPGGIDPDGLADVVAERVVSCLRSLVLKRFLSVVEAAEFSGLSADSIRTLLAGGRLTGYRPVAGRVVVDREELLAFIRSSTKAPRRRRGAYERTGARNGEGYK
jgi:hypothetical protein